ncbi:MAG: hypothetical protein WAU68_09990 [Vitreimonas sp.]
MRIILLAALAAAALAASANAQTQTAAAEPRFTGTWGFQSEDYGTDDYGLAMSGVAVITQAQGTHYNVRLLTQQQLTERESGQTHMLVGHETCSGDASNGQLAITCQADPLQDRQPDTFLLQRGDNADQLVGAITSSSNSQATFSRMQ